LVHYGQASLDRREATAARLQMSREMAQIRLDQIQQNREDARARLKRQEDRDASDAYYKQKDLEVRAHLNATNEELKRLGLDIQQQRADTAQQAVEQRGSQQD